MWVFVSSMACTRSQHQSVLIAYVAFLFQEKLSAIMVGNYLAAVRFTQVALGLGDPHMGEMTRLEYVRKGFKRSTAGAPPPPRAETSNNTRTLKAAEGGVE